MSDYSTSTEHDAAISAGFDTYPDEPPMSRADLAAEAEWMRDFQKRDLADSHQWPKEAHDRLMQALDNVLCDMCRVRPAETNGLCRACLDELRDERTEVED